MHNVFLLFSHLRSDQKFSSILFWFFSVKKKENTKTEQTQFNRPKVKNEMNWN